MSNKIFYFIFFIFILALFRIIPHPNNFTPIIASAIMAPLLLKDRFFGMLIPIFAMFISDIIIGFHPYQFVVYSTLLSISLISPMSKNYLMFGIFALGGSVWFYITTNFAVWIVWDYYPKTINGLIFCYTSALPFFKNTLISSLLFTGLLTISSKYLEIIQNKTNNLILTKLKS
tara:strand:- start:404 stop:925 length:522 start_codon:yes stop_codon:yes gene_type:complete